MDNYTKNINQNYLHSEITAKILQAFYIVVNNIGYGFGIEVFRNALIIELKELELKCEQEKIVKLTYKENEIGEFKMDILVDEKINIMIISEPNILRNHEVILSNQLKNSKIEVALLLNAYIEGEHKRIFFSNDLKPKYKK